jgi:hypothetical protein
VVVHCAASGLQYPPLVPVWGREAITLQPIRITFACFGAALAGYVEATLEDDAVKNRLCPPAPFSNTTADWARQQVLGSRASSFTSYPAIRDWADGVSLNPGRIPPELAGSAAVTAAQERLARHVGRDGLDTIQAQAADSNDEPAATPQTSAVDPGPGHVRLSPLQGLQPVDQPGSVRRRGSHRTAAVVTPDSQQSAPTRPSSGSRLSLQRTCLLCRRANVPGKPAVRGSRR